MSETLQRPPVGPSQHRRRKGDLAPSADFEAALYKYVDTANPALLRTIMEKKTLDDALKAEMLTVIKEAKQQFVAK